VGALFAYVATSAFVLQTMNGLSPILSGQIAALAADVAVLVAALWLGTALMVAIVCFFVLMTAQGLMIPNGGALASAAVPEYPGTGSAVQGFVQWVAAGTIAPIAGLGGEHTAVPLATLMITGAAVSMVGLLVLAKPKPTKTASSGGRLAP
jgi:DHA1 family bicyclomycin/chloramphenicol resistance-like MFS transporter